MAGFLPDWVLVIKSVLISIAAIAFLGPVTMMYLTLLERKVVGRMQNRIGPNRVGKWGLLQPLADGVKMLTKEDIVPTPADPIAHFLAPILIVVPALLVFAVIPFGRGMTAVDLNVGLLFFIAISSTTTLAIFMASWGSRNKFSLLGGMRSVAQMVSYEVPMVLSVVPVILITGSLSTNDIVLAQGGWGGLKWFIFTPWGLLAFIIFYLCGVAECNRSPFDLPEAESEIVAGFHTEYSGMKFALFYMAEFMNSFTISALAATLFLGGWQGPVLPSWLWFFMKTYVLIFIMIWFRGTLPRFRVDQLMNLAWKFLLPLTLINIFVAGFWYFAPNTIVRVLMSAGVLSLSFWGLQKLNQGYAPEKRVYQFGD
ncbi:MAG: NADH-quinone oxidoreductase subunit NuoH [Candidatus Omnitrophica bacterium]|nr:NADH-quinone oxidoreductase subunit NuoH [Candidatus Omnitrophota bacterium]